jgi:alpha-tubulin suppressor-like RCC1 family protein
MIYTERGILYKIHLENKTMVQIFEDQKVEDELENGDEAQQSIGIT